MIKTSYGPNWCVKANPNYFVRCTFTRWQKYFPLRAVRLRDERLVAWKWIYRREVIQDTLGIDPNAQTDERKYQYDDLVGIMKGPQ